MTGGLLPFGLGFEDQRTDPIRTDCFSLDRIGEWKARFFRLPDG
ncbi:hypothetical protein HALLA_05265 [Halostagnicola larsenii XH-48]|uniref:Uncharacterized protein n=1 Tax=Halostagnicola larsenii XH-48 TaxID=797299 RepID=W0JTY5_9EURY|nr:hypothetical protein HALLA_05265 [Halostagnicola larsenii XH-48]